MKLVFILLALYAALVFFVGCESIDSRGFSGSGTYTSGGQQYSFGVKPVETGYNK